MKYLVVILAAAAAVFGALPASAIVNVEDMRVGQPAAGVSGNLDLSLSGKSGNTETQGLALDGRVQKHQGQVTDFVILTYDYGEAGDIRNTNSALLHGRHVVQYLPRRAWEVFAQVERDEFTRLSFRGLLGGGVRFTLAEEEGRVSLHLGAGGFATRETLEQRTCLTDDCTESYARGNVYLAYKQQLNPQVKIISTTYYQPRINDAADFRALEQAALAVEDERAVGH